MIHWRKASYLVLLACLSGGIGALGQGDGDGSTTDAPRRSVVSLSIVGSDKESVAGSKSDLSIPSHYFAAELRADPALRDRIQKGLYLEVYPGIDMACYGDGHRIEYVFRLSAGADPEIVRMMMQGVSMRGAGNTSDLYAFFKGGEVIQSSPRFLHSRDGEETTGMGHYMLLDGGESAVVFPSMAGVPAWSSANSGRLNRVPGGGQPGGPSYLYYLSKYEISNDEYLRFLNSAEANAKDGRGAFMFFDDRGNVWFNPAMQTGRDEMFQLAKSRLRYDRALPVGSRYSHELNRDTNPEWARHPVSGVSWYGAVKYCNWLTITSKRGSPERCYLEGTNGLDWAPCTATNWASGVFGETERTQWNRKKGFRLPMANCGDGLAVTNAFGEFYKASVWNGRTNLLYGYGIDQKDPLRANYDETVTEGGGRGTLPIGFFNGSNKVDRVKKTHLNRNHYGIQDLSGNAGEWMTDHLLANGKLVAASLGGAWNEPLKPAHSVSHLEKWETSSAQGFRVATCHMPDEVMYMYVLFSFFMEPGAGPIEEVSDETVMVLEPGSPELKPVSTEPGEEGEEENGGFSMQLGSDAPSGEGLTYKDEEPGTDEEEYPDLPPPRDPHPRPPKPPKPPVGPIPLTRHVLTVGSIDPSAGVAVTVSQPDVSGNTDGVTEFSRTYVWGTSVDLGAPLHAGTNTFRRWLQDGFEAGTGLTLSVWIYADTFVQAEYVPPRAVTVDAVNPGGAPVTITGVTPDRNGDGDGTTVFTRTYDHNTRLLMTAPDHSGINTFVRWLQDGVPVTTNVTLDAQVLDNTTFTAEYVPPRTITVESLNPDSGVSITGVTPDLNGDTDGTTVFSRSYNNGTTVYMNAPFVAPNGYMFDRWILDGNLLTTSLTAQVVVSGDAMLVASYVHPPTLLIESRNPDSGVAITGVNPDNDGNADDSTPFTRTYFPGSNVTATAPYSATNGYVFSRWLYNGVQITTGLTASVTIWGNSILTAEYVPPPVVTFESSSPASGVSITGVTPDNNGLADGLTVFTRVYFPGTNISATAPYVAPNGNVFDRWLRDGVFLTTNMTATSPVNADMTMTAVYRVPPVLTVDSSNPGSGVSINGVTSDIGGQSNGVTVFSRQYYPGSNVTVTASYLAPNGNVFQRWLRDGVFLTSNMTASAIIVSNMTLTAEYRTAPILTVDSQNPGLGVSITGVSVDNLGQSNGVTVFTRVYVPGSNVTVRASYLAPSGNVFDRWLLDGVFLTTNPVAQAVMSGNRTLTAVYRVPPVLTIASANPGSGVGISGVTTDINGDSDGVTLFSRQYYPGSNIVATAPDIAPNGNIFLRWLFNGAFLSSNHTAGLSIVSNATLTAEYLSASVLTVESQNPASGVNITGVTVDNLGAGDGATLFTRVYRPGSNANVTASYIAPGGNVFDRWLLEGVFLTTNLGAQATMTGDRTLTAVYRAPPILTVASLNPGSGVGISGVTPDINGDSDGSTVFFRSYYPGSNITATAPLIAPNGNVFARWTLDGAYVTTDLVTIVAIESNATLVAEYSSSPVLTIDSQNPGSGVSITGVSVDNLGMSDGNTVFTRVYISGSNVSATAAYLAPGGNVFDRWLLEGVFHTTNRTAEVVMLTNATLTAVYIGPPSVSFESSSPNSGVSISGVTPDIAGLGDGTTAFNRNYYPGSNLVATASYLAPNGNVFDRWLQDGVLLTTNRSFSVVVTNATVLTAVYRPPVLVSFASQNPASGVAFSGVNADVGGLGDGTTLFTRQYYPGSNVTATAPLIAPGGNYFRRWLQDGVFLTTNFTVDVVVLSNTTLTADYRSAPIVTFESANPAAGVSLTGVSVDNTGLGDGATLFNRVYMPGSNIVATAPFIAPNGNVFERWLQNGAFLTTNLTVGVTVLTNTTLTAFYGGPPTVTFESQNPGSGVSISNVTTAIGGLSDGTTVFSRQYYPGSNVSATASLIAPNGNLFARWLQDGAFLSASPTIGIIVQSNTTLRAVYETSPTVTFASQNPNSGVTIAGVSTDNFGSSDGSTIFTRTYALNSNIVATAPYLAPNGNVFDQWLQDGLFLTTNRTLGIPVTTNTTLTATYRVPPTVTFESQNPVSGVSITNVTPAIGGLGNGTTLFSRQYYPGSNVSATASLLSPGGNMFLRWLQDGVFLSSNRAISVIVLSNTTLRAVYETSPVVTFASQNPNSAVTISGVSPDVFGNTDGSTAFLRTYQANSNIVATAPYLAPNGNIFDRWLQDGALLTTNRNIGIVVVTNTTITAAYRSAPTVSFQSFNPNSGVGFTGVTPDIGGLGDGTTAFTRQYYPGTNVTVTAPPVAPGGNVFVRWMQDGVYLTNSPSASIMVVSNTVLLAEYETAANVTFESSNPNSGVSITGVSRDNLNLSDGATSFDRLYIPITNITATASYLAPNGNVFEHWLDGGVFLTTNLTMTATITNDHVFTAVYRAPPTVSFQSFNPNSGVDFTGVTLDNGGLGDGTTAFTRQYYPGTNVTVTAPPVAPGGNVFVRWMQDGVYLTNSPSASIMVVSNTVLRAEYETAANVTFESSNPNSGVSITGVSRDNLDRGDGVTSFDRLYIPITNITATAPYVAPNGNVFVHWLDDGVFLTNGLAMTATITNDHVFTAVYQPPPTVSFESLNPNSGVNITGVTLDIGGQGNGATAFSREYYPGSNVAATASEFAPNGNVFRRWTQDGVFLTSNLNVLITVLSNTTLTAVYETAALLTVNSANPASSVSITGVSVDTLGLSDGLTAFTRTYVPGTSVVATASYLAPGGNVFDRWLKDGVFATTNRTLGVTMSSNTTITAVYRIPPVLTVLSVLPDSGVAISNVTADISGLSNGVTTFTRTYYPGSNVTAEAPIITGLSLFDRWLYNGVFLTTNPTASITIVSNSSLTAVFTPFPVVTVDSINPGSGVSIVDVTPDATGASNGVTVFSRTYLPGTNVTMTASFAATNGNAFVRWLQDGVPSTTNRTITIVMAGDTLLTAEYELPPVVTFESQNPAGGVSITGVSVDNGGLGNGITSFERTYFKGTNVSATASYVAPNGYYFDRWLQDGSLLTTNRTMTIPVSADTTLTAVYVPPYNVTFQSQNPNLGVSITDVTLDNTGLGGGNTTFVRQYFPGSNVAATASYVALNGNVFDYWLQDGVLLTTNRTVGITVLTNTSLTAVYRLPPVVTFVSANPNSGVTITNVTTDVGGQGPGVTTFSRTYYPGSNVSATASYLAPNGNVFRRWLQDGVFLSTNQSISLLVVSNTTLTAEYLTAAVVTFASQDPNSGVSITNVSPDNLGNGSGLTSFDRVYVPGTNISASASYVAANGNVFNRWLQDGVFLTTNRTLGITVATNTILTAVYSPPPVVTFASLNPNSGVTITNVTTDMIGQGSGATIFSRTYFPGSNVSASASYIAPNGNVFQRWLQDGVFLSTNLSVTVLVTSNTTLTAEYVTAPVVTFASQDPNSGVNITGVSRDNLGGTDGMTEFDRIYVAGTNISATAPYLAPGGNVFDHWSQDGSPLTTNRTASIVVTADTTLTAVYRPPPVITFESLNPNSGVTITNVTADIVGQGSGDTIFSRTYYPGSNVSATASLFAPNGNIFGQWLQDGAFLTTNRSITVLVVSNTTLTAEYLTATIVTFASQNPNSGVSITNVSMDNVGNSDGPTEFDRVYVPGTNISATAPYLAPNGNVFDQWLQDGTLLTTNRTVSILVAGDTTLTAVYRPPPVITFESLNPNSGVTITNVTADIVGQGSGDTVFSRTYYPGSNVSATASYLAPNGNVFSQWSQDGVFFSSNRSITVTVASNTTLTAEYQTAAVVTFASENPVSGVNIGGVSTDNLGNSDDTTEFDRLYVAGTNISATAPYLAPGGNVFDHWSQDGNPLTTNRTVSILVAGDTTLTAVYRPPPVITFESLNPNSGVTITNVTVDIVGQGAGSTVFSRTYYPGSNVVAEASYLAPNGNVFSQWSQDGVFLSTNRSITVLVVSNTTLTAEYLTAPVVTFASQDPDLGVTITGVSMDNMGNTNGVTEFDRIYVTGTNINATAPYLAPGGNVFDQWLQDGSLLTTNRTANITVTADTVLTAVYRSPPVVVFESLNPNSTVVITNVTTDIAGQASGETMFNRQYYPGSNVSATASYLAPNGNVFSQWSQDGVFLSSNRSITVLVVSNTTLRAEYSTAPVVTFASLAPASGVNIGGVSADNLGNSDDTTEFDRIYVAGTNISATAPYLAPGGNVFDQWLQDGSLLTTNRTVSIVVTADTTLTAVYRVPPTVTFQSSNPASGVAISGVTVDNNLETDGSTTFIRTYYPGSNVSATASYIAPDGNVFSQWSQDGAFLSTNLSITFLVTSNTTLVAEYVTAPVVTFASQAPGSGVAISGVTMDNLGNTNGVTEFSRIYVTGTDVAATAPYLAPGGNVFDQWLQDGILLTTNRDVSATVTVDTTLTAVYRPPPVVSFESANPNAGVTITNVTADITGQASAGTAFSRTYYPGSNVTAEAPYFAPAGNVFLHWLQDGAWLTSNMTVSIVTLSNTTLTAVYATAPVVTFASQDPNSGVTISGVTVDNVGQSNGVTAFTRVYVPGSNVVATAPYLAPGGNVFDQWLQDGVLLTTNRDVAITVSGNTTLTAVYRVPPVVTFESLNPNALVTITNVTMDIFGQASGDTPFPRSYYPGSNVSATASYFAPNGNVFSQWLQDGVFLTTNRSMTVIVASNTTLTAVYSTSPVLTVDSLNPATGVPITDVTTDNLGFGDASTLFTRIYVSGSIVTATAPAVTVSGNTFKQWLQDSVFLTSNLTASITIATNTTLTAEYIQAVELTVNSLNPNAGVSITNVSVDNLGDANGVTDFTRFYVPGSNVTLTASPEASNGNIFYHWLTNGVLLTSNLVANFEIAEDLTLTAVYGLTPVVVTVQSVDPSSGVNITDVSQDLDAETDGLTEFTRAYVNGWPVHMTASFVATNGNVFRRWEQDSVLLTTNRTFNINVTTNTTVTAYYEWVPLGVTLEFNPTNILRTAGPGASVLTATAFGGNGDYVAFDYEFVLLFHQWNTNWQHSALADAVTSNYDWDMSIKYRVRVMDSTSIDWSDWSNEAYLWVSSNAVPPDPMTQSGL